MTDITLTHALGVIVLDHRIREWLAANDPKALEQAIDALIGSEPAYAARLAEARLNRESLLERAQSDAPTGGDWAIDAAMAEAEAKVYTLDASGWPLIINRGEAVFLTIPLPEGSTGDDEAGQRVVAAARYAVDYLNRPEAEPLTKDEANDLIAGDRVTWVDPDGGLCTKTFTIATVAWHNDEDDMLVITDTDGDELQCPYAELRAAK